MIRVLLVDDSSFVRDQIRALLSSDRDFLVVGEARNGREALEMTVLTQPDVIVMDVDMPVMDGIDATRAIMEQRPTPILIHTSSSISRQRNLPFEAVRIGALDIVEKPSMYPLAEHDRRDFLARLRMLSGIHVFRRPSRTAAGGTGTSAESEPDRTPRPIPQETGTGEERTPVNSGQDIAPATDIRSDVSTNEVTATRTSAPGTDIRVDASPPERAHIVPPRPAATRSDLDTLPRLLAIAASTGGPRALAELFRALPPVLPFPIVLVQHIGVSFVQSFAEWLQSLTSVQIRIARDGEVLAPNTCTISPGTAHLAVRPGLQVHLDGSPPRNSCRPSADVLFESVSTALGPQSVGVLLTGIGQDGAEGLLRMREAGCFTIAQNEASSVVFGMPRRAIELKAASMVGDIDDIAAALQRAFRIR